MSAPVAYIELDLFGLGISKKMLVPAQWNQLSDATMSLMGKEIFSTNSAPHLCTELLHQWAKEQKTDLPSDLAAWLSPEQASLELLPVLNHFFEKIDRTVAPWKEGRAHPADDFNEITCGTFEDCEAHFILYAEDKNEEHLIEIADLLYGDKAFAKDHWREVYLYYSGCRQHIMQMFPAVFKSGGDGGNVQAVAAFTRLIHSGAGERNGSRRDIRSMPLKEFLFDITLQIEQNEALEAEMKKHA